MVDQRYPEDNQLEAWIREAGDPNVQPSADHLDKVRRMILDRTEEPRSGKRWLTRSALLIVAGSAAALLLGLFPWGNSARLGWAQVVQATQAKPWVHGAFADPDGEVCEFWFSPSLDYAARRRAKHVMFADLKRKIRFTYDPAKKTVVCSLERAGDDVRSLEAVFVGIARGDAKLGSPVPRGETVAQSQSEVERGGRTWLEYELTVENELFGHPPRILTTEFVFRVDPETRLVGSMRVTQPRESEAANDVEIVVDFDYPDEGPSDIYALGVPRSAKIDDRSPKGDLAQIVAANRAGRERLTSYYAVYDKSFGPPEKFVELDLHRLWRKGACWRLEMAIPNANAVQAVKNIVNAETPPEGFNTATWWAELLRQFDMWPREVCDGERVYQSTSSDPQTRKWEARQAHSPEVTAVRGESSRFAVERYAYPSLMIPSEEYLGIVDMNPEDGPPGTVLLTVQPTADSASGRRQLHKFWLDPRREYVTCRLERYDAEFKMENGKLTTVTMTMSEAYVNEDFKQSPHGAWYPTVVRRENALDLDDDGKKESDEVLRFRLFFDMEMPDSLFQPEG